MENNGIRLNSKVESTQVAMNIYTIESQSISCKYVNKIYIRISSFTLQYNYDKTTWKLIKIRKWYSKLWCSENIAYMYVHNENFWGRKLSQIMKFCGYLQKCSIQSLVHMSFGGSSKQFWKFSPAKISCFTTSVFASTDTNIYLSLC